MTNVGFAKYRIELHLHGSVDVTGANDVMVHWVDTVGGEVDPVTGALVGGEEVPRSGVLRGFGYEVPAKQVLRQFQEIEAGDLLLDVLPEAPVTTYPSGVVTALDALEGKGVQLEWGGQLYTQKEVGERLAHTWDVIVNGLKLGRTILLKKAT